MKQDDLLAAALEYASFGWHVFPAHSIKNGKCTCGKACDSPGKHPMISGGVYAATTDEEQIRDWWKRWPGANVGIATGQVSGCFVLDVDSDKGGIEQLEAMVAQHGMMQPTATANTGGGGMHIYCKYPASKVPNKVRFDKGLDTRGDGGYVIAPPSAHLSGTPYEWQLRPVPNGSGRPKLAPAPPWLLEAIKRAPQEYNAPVVPTGGVTPGHRKYAAKVFDTWRSKLAQAQSGERNNLLNKAAYALGTYVGSGYLDRTEVERELTGIAQIKGLDADEIRKTFASGMKAGQQKPVAIPDLKSKSELFSPPFLRVGGEKKPIDEEELLSGPVIGMGPEKKPIDAQKNTEEVEDNSFVFSEETQKGEKKPIVNRYTGIPISQLEVDEAVMGWAWHGIAGPQLTTLFTSLWKAGKTTLLAGLLGALDGNVRDFCGLPVTPCKVLVVTEEPPRKWIERRSEFQIRDHVSIISKPFLKSPSKGDWVVLLATIAEQVKTEGFRLVVFDTIFNLWPVLDENDAAQVKDALTPLNMILMEGAGVLLMAHPKKGDAAEGQATRGTGALPAAVDIIIEMRRYDPSHATDTRRTLTSYSRYEETPKELVIQYDIEDHAYRAMGSKADVKYVDRLRVLLEVLPGNGISYTVEEIFQNWPTDGDIPRPSDATLRRDLAAGCKDGVIKESGSGTKGDALRYRRSQAE